MHNNYAMYPPLSGLVFEGSCLSHFLTSAPPGVPTELKRMLSKLDVGAVSPWKGQPPFFLSQCRAASPSSTRRSRKRAPPTAAGTNVSTALSPVGQPKASLQESWDSLSKWGHWLCQQSSNQIVSLTYKQVSIVQKIGPCSSVTLCPKAMASAGIPYLSASRGTISGCILPGPETAQEGWGRPQPGGSSGNHVGHNCTLGPDRLACVGLP